MARKKRVSFLARVRIKRTVSFKAGKKRVSFKARLPSKRKVRVTFLSRRRKK